MFARTLVVAVLLAFGVAATAATPLQSFQTADLTIDTAGGPQHFTIELADTPLQQEQGLMFRRQMAADAGMLFTFPDSRTAEFWMHNTFIPLDMVFIAADGHIADLHERAVPMSDAIVASTVPVHAVLELNGGTIARLGLKVGDLVHHANFGTAGGH